MSADAVEFEILAPMQRLFLPPQRMDDGQQVQALREYVAALQAFEAVDLNGAWQSVRDSHTTRTWPAPAVFVLAARRARNDRVPLEKRSAKSDKPNPATLWAIWERFRGSDLAMDAYDRGVSWAFKFAILGGTPPASVNLTELEVFKASAARTAEKIETVEVISHNGRDLRFSEDAAHMALKMWRTIQIRNAETDSEIRRARGLAA